MSSVRRRPENGKLYWDFQYSKRRCREYTQLDDTLENRANMEAKLAAIEREIASGTFNYSAFFPESKNAIKFGPFSNSKAIAASAAQQGLALNPPQAQPTTPEFAAFSRGWFDQMSPTWRESTREAYRSLLDVYLYPEFGPKPLGEITRDDILSARAKFAAHRLRNGNQRSAKSVNEAMGLLSTVMAEACLRYPISNPTARIKRLKEKRVDIFPFKLEEVQALLQKVRTDYASYLAVRFFTGMRTGEINGLKWHYVDFDAGLILVRETWTKGRVEYTKTDGSQRDIEMSSVVRQALLDQIKLTKHRGEYVFCNRDGSPLDAKNFCNRVWYPLLRHLSLRKRRPYQTRHTCATLWLGAGENPEWIARQLGHSTTEMLFKVYSRYIPNLTRKDGSAFEQMLAKTTLAPKAREEVPHG